MLPLSDIAARSTENDKYRLRSNLIFNGTDSMFQCAGPPLPTLFPVEVTNVHGTVYKHNI